MVGSFLYWTPVKVLVRLATTAMWAVNRLLACVRPNLSIFVYYRWQPNFYKCWTRALWVWYTPNWVTCCKTLINCKRALLKLHMHFNGASDVITERNENSCSDTHLYGVPKLVFVNSSPVCVLQCVSRRFISTNSTLNSMVQLSAMCKIW